MDDPDDFQGQLKAFQTDMRKVFEKQRLEAPLPPTREASALMLKQVLDAEQLAIAQHSATLSTPEKLAAFTHYLEGLRWKRFHCHKTPEQEREHTARAMLELERQYRTYRGFTIPSGEPGDLRRSASRHDNDDAETATPDPHRKQRQAWEEKANEERLKALGTCWSEFALPLAQSASDVAEIAQAEGHDTNVIRDADVLSRDLTAGCLLAPSDETMELADRVLLLAKQLMRAKPRNPGKRRSSNKQAKPASKPGAGRLGNVDQALVRLLFQDLTTGWAMGILDMSNKSLAEQIRGSRPRQVPSGSLRPGRIPHFLAFREFFRENRKGRPLDLIRGLPDNSLRDDLEQYVSEAQED